VILAVDSSALILLINPAANPPDDPETEQPVTHARERVELFLAGLSSADTLIIPTPVLAEVLVGAEEGGPGLLEAISGLARVKVRPFGERAAIETAMMTREAIAAGDKRLGSQAPWQKVKVDRQVVAVVRAENATRMYADDHNLVKFARKLGMDVFSTWDLPVPDGVENLFTAAGVPIDPRKPATVTADEVSADDAPADYQHYPRPVNLDGDTHVDSIAAGGEADLDEADGVHTILRDLEQSEATPLAEPSPSTTLDAVKEEIPAQARDREMERPDGVTPSGR
jgi:hypothetical protein